MRYLEELKKQAAEQKEFSAKKKALGFEKTDDATYYPMPPMSLPSLASPTKRPSTKPFYEVELLPNAKISPTLGLGMGGPQMRLRVKRDVEGVPSGSIIDKGLKNQSATGAGIDIGLKPKAT